MGCLLLFADAAPQEHLSARTPPVWYTVAAVGVLLEESPLASKLLSPTARGVKRLLKIPDPKGLRATLQSKRDSVITSWKNIRGNRRRERAAEELLKGFSAGDVLFLSHSTRSDIAAPVARRYLMHYCNALVRRDELIGSKGFVARLPGGKLIYPAPQRVLSLAWLAHCFDVFLSKARASFPGYVDGVFLHDRLPFNRADELELLQAMVAMRDPGHVYIESRETELHDVADNLAAVTNAALVDGVATLQKWFWDHGRPRNFYMTVDEDESTYTRYI